MRFPRHQVMTIAETLGAMRTTAPAGRPRPGMVARVHSLLVPCGPPAITGGVVAVVVDPVKAVARRRSFPHMLEKHLEGLRPFSADLDAATSVVGVVLGVWILAGSLLHSAPGRVLDGSTNSGPRVSGLPVLLHPGGCDVIGATAARLRMAAKKVGLAGHHLVATGAAAGVVPVLAGSTFDALFHCSKASEDTTVKRWMLPHATSIY